MIFYFYFINFFKLLTFTGPKSHLKKTSYKIFQFHRKKGAKRIKMAFWAFKSQNFEKVYNTKILLH